MAAITYPRRAHFAYETMVSAANAANLDLVIGGNTDGGAGTDAAAVKSGNPQLKYFTYLVMWAQGPLTNGAYDAAGRQVLQNNPTWLLRQYGSRMVLGDGAAFMCPGGTPDGNGDLFPAWYAKRMWDSYIAPAPAIDGVFLDVFQEAPVTAHSVLKGGALGTGTCQAGSNATTIVTTGGLTVSGLVNYFLTLLTGNPNTSVGPGAIARQKISANDATNITVPAFGTAPTTATVYAIEGYEDTAVAPFNNTSINRGTGAAWAVNEWQDGWVDIVSGTGAGQLRKVASNTASAITPYDAWTVTPDATSVFEVHANPTSTTLIGGDNSKVHAVPYPTETVLKTHELWSQRYQKTQLAALAAGVTALRARAVAAGRTDFKIMLNGASGMFRIGPYRGLADGGMYENAFEFPTQGATYGEKNRISAVRKLAEICRQFASTDAGYPLANSNLPSNTSWDYCRMGLCATLMTDAFHATRATDYSQTVPMILDEYKIALGAALDPMQTDVAAGKTYWRRRFAKGMAVWNPTASAVTVIEPGYKRFNAASYANQSPAINNGATAGGAGFSLAANSGIVLINE